MMGSREMPFSEKYTITLDRTKLMDTIVPPLIKRHLGDQGEAELEGIWREGCEPIPDDVSPEDKYQIAFANWLWRWSSAYNYIREHLGEDGVKEFKRACVDALKRDASGLGLLLLGVVRFLSPGSAFSMMAKRMAYQRQALGPFSVTELSDERVVIDLPRCKVLDYPGGEEACLVGCQEIYPVWIAEQFRAVMKAERRGKSCTVTITPSR